MIYILADVITVSEACVEKIKFDSALQELSH
jgi:hypothetical protein